MPPNPRSRLLFPLGPVPGSAAPGLAGALAAAAGVLLSCSAAPVKMECREIEMRIDYGDLTADQLRFALRELEECKGRLKSAEAKDSALIEGTQERFTPADP